jgi:RNA polymerase sigma-70 factor (ECF subfamily)
MPPPTPTALEAHLPFRTDLQLVQDSLRDERGRNAFLERLRCVPRMLAAKNAALGRVLDDGELEDLAQETLLTIWEKRAQYSGRSSIETWIYPFCYNHLMNRLRRHARRRRAEPLEAAQELPAATREDFGFVYRALEHIGPPEEDVLRLKHFENLTFTEIARALGISPNTAKSRYYHGLERLRLHLKSRKEGEAT